MKKSFRFTSRHRAKVFSWIIILTMLCFEVISYASNKEGLMILFGMLLWAKLLAFSFTAVDFAGVGLLLMGVKREEGITWKVWMFGAWIASALFDSGLTAAVIYLNSYQRLSTHILVTSGAVPPWFMSRAVPIGMALVIWAVQCLLVAAMPRALSDVLDLDDSRSMRPSQPRRNNPMPPPPPDMFDLMS
jgi:hypothetical protein